MAFSDEALKGSVLTEAFIQRDLKILIPYYENMEMKAQLIPAAADMPLPSLLAALPNDDEGRPRFITHSFVPLEKDDAEYTKYLQFYTELQDSLEGIDRQTLLEALNRLNFNLPFGACILVAERPEQGLPAMVTLRSMQGFPIDEPIDQGVFTEDVFLFDLSCTVTSVVITGLSEGKSIDEVFEAIGR